MWPPADNQVLIKNRPVGVQLESGALIVRTSVLREDIGKAQAFRAQFFGADPHSESDVFDTTSVHLLVEDRDHGRLVACCRLNLCVPQDLPASYSGQFYDLSRLQKFPGSMVEIGRFCVDPLQRNSDAIRLVWAMIGSIVDACDIQFMFGCTSFAGTDDVPYRASFDILQARYLAPEEWRPTAISPDIIRFTENPSDSRSEFEKGWAATPALLRTYLSMGGWVSDHVVVDHNLGTLHVFTGVEVATIPPARKKQLRHIINQTPAKRAVSRYARDSR